MRLKFIDSFQFLSSSLSTLAKNLPEVHYARHIQKVFPTCSDSIIVQKGVFPYSYLSSEERLWETQLPPKEAFTNDLTKEEISDDDYHHAQKAWSELQCQTLCDYMLRYLELDVLLLTDVFETFRQKCLKEDKLDPVHYISLPQLSYDAAFKMTNENIDLLTDPAMYGFFQRGIRGGMTTVNKHLVHSKPGRHLLMRSRHDYAAPTF